jgi:hypothetical protein
VKQVIVIGRFKKLIVHWIELVYSVGSGQEDIAISHQLDLVHVSSWQTVVHGVTLNHFNTVELVIEPVLGYSVKGMAHPNHPVVHTGHFLTGIIYTADVAQVYHFFRSLSDKALDRYRFLRGNKISCQGFHGGPNHPECRLPEFRIDPSLQKIPLLWPQ